MPSEHWFDKWHLGLGGQVRRRGLFRSAGVLVAGLSALSPPAPSQAKKKRRSKHHQNGNGKPKKQSPPRCGESECALEWPADYINRNECELKCGRCRLREKFCIVEGDPANPDHVATCCFNNQSCCPDASSATGHACVDTTSNTDHCGRCDFACPPGLTCVGGRCLCPDDRRLCVDGCVDTQTDPRNCRECGTVCPDQWSCCGANCVDKRVDSNDCGECGHQCPFGDGAPSDCCNGVCTNTATDQENCGRCGRPCPPDRACCGGNCYDPAQFRCCPDGVHFCRTDIICCQDDLGWTCCV
jgi:Stigma-specific protein, Stig1